MTAARTGRVDTVKALLARGADVNSKVGRQGETALIWAAAEGNDEVVGTLIKAGADFRARSSSGFTPFLFAVREGHIGVVKTLLKNGADVNDAIRPAPNYARGGAYGAIPRPGTSAMLLAVLNAHYELAAYLLDAGADPNSDTSGWTAIHAITGVRKPGTGDNDPAPDGSGNMSSIEFVKKIVASGANVNARMTKRINVGMTRAHTMGATPFFLAARSADAELMRVLAKLGADPLLPNAENSTPLMAAAGLGTRSPGEDAGTEPEVLEAVQVALELGNDINAVDNNGETAMHGAAYKNLPAVVELLASKGARIEVWHQKNKFGWTPLSIAEGHRFGNYKPSPVTIAAFHRVMTAAGVKPFAEPDASGMRRNSDYGPRPPR
jgi:ankyrin repeat protein